MTAPFRPPQFVIAYQRPPLLEDHEVDPYKGADRALTEQIARFIVETYPRIWMFFHARVDHSQGIATLSMPRLMGALNVAVMKIDEIQIGPSAFTAAVRRAAGEMLERYRLSRSRRASADAMLEAINNAPIIGLNNAPVPE
jgi:hypothetical protein